MVAAMADVLCDLEAVAATASHHYGRTFDKDDALVAEAARTATARFRADIRHHLTLQEDLTLVLDGTGTTVLRLPVLNPTVDRVLVDGEPVEGWRVSAAGLVSFPAALPRAYGAVEVHVARCGLEEAPEEVLAVVGQAAVITIGQQPGVQSMTVGGMSLSYGSTSSLGVTEAWTNAVEAYRIKTGDRA